MGRKEDNIKRATALFKNLDNIRNIGTAAHIDHGKTTLSDNLIFGAGMMSEDLAGKQLMLDFDEQESARGITINAANASMVHEHKGEDYLINLIDTPGHVDFGGDVTRAMRALDGVIIVVCAVEGIMPQTETVIIQALKEKVKPVLFINKVDRLIAELQVTPEDMMQRFGKIITEVNKLISRMVPDEFKKDWTVDAQAGTVAFGSAYHNWATSIPFMAKKEVNFKQIYDFMEKEQRKELAHAAPLHEVLLDMIVEKLPSASVSQKYRIPHIWRGESEEKIGQSMMNAEASGDTAFMVTKVVLDPHAGEIAVGRLFSGTVKKGDQLYVAGMPSANRVQSVGMFVGGDRINTENVTAGNIIAVSGLRDAISGSTISSDKEMTAFERIIHNSEPVVTTAIEAKHTKDLPKLVEVLRAVAKADPSIQIDSNLETGEHLMSGMGELHLEITEYRIRNEHSVEITTSPPIVVYRETVAMNSPGNFEGKSPNKHNRFYITVEPLEEDIRAAIIDGTIPSGDIKKSKEVARQLIDMGWAKVHGRGVLSIENSCVFIDATKGIQNLFETRELLIDAFKEVVKRGPRAHEKMMGVKIILNDAKLHEDAIHRGPAQTIPAVRNGINGALVSAGVALLEPKQNVYITVPQELMGSVTGEMAQRRAEIAGMETEGDMAVITAKAPVKEMFGFASEIRSATGGRALWSTEFSGYEELPPDLLNDITEEIRQRKGLKPEMPRPENYAG
uniref:Elongation factor 2 n=1 Tax=uncultured marine group II/III euryarchaeote AD1000_53_H05 TaxID=1457782 RepID=A0A075FZ63_9EURY|nr:translation elongation factor aEF-2 [uncultured marine group II/III euryarchaeote AD1000_53_H05]